MQQLYVSLSSPHVDVLTVKVCDASGVVSSVLAGIDLEAEHCIIGYNDGKVMLVPSPGAICTVNGVTVTESCQLSQGAHLHSVTALLNCAVL